MMRELHGHYRCSLVASKTYALYYAWRQTNIRGQGMKIGLIAASLCVAFVLSGCDNIKSYNLQKDLGKHISACANKNTVDCTNEAIDLSITALELTTNGLDQIADTFTSQGLPEEFSEVFVERYNEVIDEKVDEFESKRPWFFKRWFMGDSKPSDKVVFDMVAIQNDFLRVTPGILQELVDDDVMPEEARIMMLKLYLASMNMPKDIRAEFERALNPTAHAAKSFAELLGQDTLESDPIEQVAQVSETAHVSVNSKDELIKRSFNAYLTNALSAEDAGTEYEEARQVLHIDLDGNGLEDAVVLYTIEGEGGVNGSHQMLSVLINNGSDFTHAYANYAPITDKIESKGEGVVALSTLQHGPDDPQCCPSETVELSYLWTGSELKEAPST